MSTLDCCNPCGTIQVTQVPGNEGPSGVDGTDGVSAYTTTLDDIVIVVSPNTTVTAVVSSVWMVVGQILIIGSGFGATVGGPAHFIVIAVPTATSVEIQYLGSSGDVSPGDTIFAGAIVSPSAA